MLTIRRDDERAYFHRAQHKAWHSFYGPNPDDPLASGFSSLEVLSECMLPPGKGVWLSSMRPSEIVTYVRRGRVRWQGKEREESGGEFDRQVVRNGTRHRLFNASQTEPAHVFQLWLKLAPSSVAPREALDIHRCPSADRRGQLLRVASGRGETSALRLHADTEIFSALLGPGQHLVYPGDSGRHFWLHVVSGRVTVGDTALLAGDGVGGQLQPTVSMRAETEAEILLLDLL